MKNFVLALGAVVALGLCAPNARAQVATVDSCATVAVPTGSGAPLIESTAGILCGLPGSGSAAATQDVNLKQVNGAAVNVGTGAASTGTQRVSTSTDSTIATVGAVTAITNALPAGTNVIGHVITDTTSTTAVTAASGSIASGAIASGAVASGAYASGSISDGAEVTLGAKADAKSTSTDTTPITAMQVLKEISAMEQAPASRAVTNAGTFATQPTLQAGTAIAGKFGIDQTTDVTTNGVEIAPTAGAGAGITPVVSASAEGTHVLKGSAGNLYGVTVTTGATAGYLMVFNATSAPVDGAVTPLECIQATANSTTGVTFNSGPPEVYSTGISVAFSTTGCFTKTASATAFFNGRVK